MIIYLAGRGHGAPQMKHRLLYENALFSKFQYSKKNYRWLKRRKAREQCEQTDKTS